MPITQVLLTNISAAGGPPPPPPPPSPQGTYYFAGSMLPWGSVSNPRPTYTAASVLPDGVTTAQTWAFNGAGNLMTTGGMSQWSQFYLNLWFYPTNVNTIIMTLQGQLTENINWHHSALEINGNLTVRGGFWNGVSINQLISANTVTLNQWNHIHLRHNGTQALLQLNGGTAVTSTFAWSPPVDMVVGFGTISVTNMGNSGRYQGTIDGVELNNTSMASNYSFTRARYETSPTFYYDDFTIEWWQKAESAGVNSRPWAIGLLGSASGQEISLSYEGVGRDYFWINDGYPAQEEYRPIKNHYGIGWEHMAIVRKNGEVKLYSNGTNYMTWPSANQAVTALNAELVIGTGEIPNGNYRGYIKDLYIVKGYAKYTANFTPLDQPVTPALGGVFLLRAQSSATAFDDSVGNKVGVPVNAPQWVDYTPWTYPTQTFTAAGYGAQRIAFTTSLPIAEPRIGLLVSDQHGWSDYIVDIPIPNHIDFANAVPTRDPGEIYTIEEVALSDACFSGGGSGQLLFGYNVLLLGVQVGWYVSVDGGISTIGRVTAVSQEAGPSIQIMVNFNPLSVLGSTFTFSPTPYDYGGSIYFSGSNYINYGSSVDWAIDVDGIETSGLTMRLDANDPLSYTSNSTIAGIWYDTTLNASNVTLYNNPYYVAGAQSYVEFDGVNQYGTCAVNSLLPSTAYTKMVWFRLNTLNADNNIVSNDTGGHYMYFNNGNRMWTGHSNVTPYSGPGAFGSTSTFSADTWYCVTVTYDSGTSTIKLYINGVLDNSTTMIPHTGNGRVNLGCFGAGGNLLNGRIGSVLCYNVALTDSQVLRNYTATRNRYDVL